MFGVGGALHPSGGCIDCRNVLGSGNGNGTTGPTSLGPETAHGACASPASAFATRCGFSALAGALGIRAIWLVREDRWEDCQRSSGGCLIRVGCAVATNAASGRHSDWCLPWSEAQPMALTADPKYRGGNYPIDDSPAAGLGSPAQSR